MRIEEIVLNYGKNIYNYALKLSCHPEDAKDLAQETFIKAWSKQDQLREEKAMLKWLQTICYHLFLMKLRQNDTKNQLLFDDIEALEAEGTLLVEVIPGPEDEVIVEEAIRDLQNGCFLAMVRKLTLNQRITFSLIDMFGMRIEEVSELLGVSVSATKGLLYRARMSIDSFFADHCNLIHVSNTCSCKAWIDFNLKRDELQQKTKNLITHLDYRDKNYLFDESIRRKVQALYSHMPDKKPGDGWFEQVINTLSNV